jgi:cytochrome b subunit of formate dehydrogenase
MEKNRKQISLFVEESSLQHSTHAKLACVACHTKFNPEDLPHKAIIEPVRCINCHNNAPLEHSFHPQLLRANGTFTSSGVNCKNCHGTHEVISSQNPASRLNASHLTETCGECHADIKEKFSLSAHGSAMQKNIQGAPHCLHCHSNAIMRSGTENDTLLAEIKIRQEKMCLSCHLDNPDVKSRTSPTAKFIASYEKSVHGSALLKGKGKAANCVDCHGSHEMKKGVEQSSRVGKQHVVETCSKCHSAIAKTFSESIHGTAVANGNNEAPVCTDCHGEHNIFKHDDPRSRVASKNVAAQVCSLCHSSVKLSEKYGIATDRFKTFSDSYHGMASRAGSVEVANCASCHGAHNIKKPNDSSSTINKAQLATTCGKCHPGANDRFAMGSVHVTLAEKEEPVLYWIATVYILLIIVTIGGMFVHNVADFLKKSKRKLLIRRGVLQEEHTGYRLYVRMTLNERLQHAALLISFSLLVVSGFMLHYPEVWWVRWMQNLSNNVFDMRSLMHRIAGVIMILASIYHIIYATVTIRGRELMSDLLPRWNDVTDIIASVKYNFGLSTIKPKYGRFSYVEKSEYWALVWGTFVMAATGIIMWFDNYFMNLFTKFGWDIARTIHFYEAWLATLAIIVWHFYFVIFNPEAYPINLAFWKGTISEAEMAEEHPLELEELRKKEIKKDFNEVNIPLGKKSTEDASVEKK